MSKQRDNDEIADAIRYGLNSSNVMDSNGETANVVDVLQFLANAVAMAANGIKDTHAAAGKDETGGTVTCLTEAVMGTTGALCKIADSINNLADAVREHKN